MVFVPHTNMQLPGNTCKLKLKEDRVSQELVAKQVLVMRCFLKAEVHGRLRQM
jgi:hypothetical protein